MVPLLRQLLHHFPVADVHRLDQGLLILVHLLPRVDGHRLPRLRRHFLVSLEALILDEQVRPIVYLLVDCRLYYFPLQACGSEDGLQNALLLPNLECLLLLAFKMLLGGQLGGLDIGGDEHAGLKARWIVHGSRLKIATS
jgi:hypothetical protein